MAQVHAREMKAKLSFAKTRHLNILALLTHTVVAMETWLLSLAFTFIYHNARKCRAIRYALAYLGSLDIACRTGSEREDQNVLPRIG